MAAVLNNMLCKLFLHVNLLSQSMPSSEPETMLWFVTNFLPEASVNNCQNKTETFVTPSFKAKALTD